jgi:hypothetical protein
MTKGHSTGREPPNGNFEATEQASTRRSIRSHLRDGIEAALCADPGVSANCNPRTVLGLIVRGLVLEAGKGKMTAVKMIMQFVDWDGEDAEPQEISGEAHWDWSADRVWLTRPQAETGEPAPMDNATSCRATLVTGSRNRPRQHSPEGPENVQTNSLSEGISQGILKKVAPEAAEQTAPPNRQRRRRLAAMMRQREKEEARLGRLARAA